MRLANGEGIFFTYELTCHPFNIKTWSPIVLLPIHHNWLWFNQFKVFKGDSGVKSTLKSNLPAVYYFQSFYVGWRRGMLLHDNSLSLPPLQMADGDFICAWRDTQVPTLELNHLGHSRGDTRSKTSLFGHKKHKHEPLTSCHVRLPHNNSPPTQSLAGTCHTQHNKLEVYSYCLQWSALLVWFTICSYALSWIFYHR